MVTLATAPRRPHFGAMDAMACPTPTPPSAHPAVPEHRRDVVGDVVGHVLVALSRESSVDRLYSHAMDAIAVALHVDRASLLIFDHQQRCRFVA